MTTTDTTVAITKIIFEAVFIILLLLCAENEQEIFSSQERSFHNILPNKKKSISCHEKKN